MINRILITLLLISSNIFSQNLKSLESEISLLSKKNVPFVQKVSISSTGDLVVYEKYNEHSSEISYNLKNIEIMGIEENDQDDVGEPIGKYRILLTCNSGDCVTNKEFEINNGKKIFKKSWKNKQAWYYLNSYSTAEILETKLKLAKSSIE